MPEGLLFHFQCTLKNIYNFEMKEVQGAPNNMLCHGPKIIFKSESETEIKREQLCLSPELFTYL